MYAAMPPRLPIGAPVEYLSTSAGGWCPAIVHGFNEGTGTYMLNTHPAAHPSKVRPVAAAAGGYAPVFAPPTAAGPPMQAATSDDFGGGPPPMHSIRQALPLQSLIAMPCARQPAAKHPPIPVADGVKCPSGHPMTAKVGREILSMFKRRSSTELMCDQCSASIDLKEDALYRCKECGIDVCLSCVAQMRTAGPVQRPGHVPMQRARTEGADVRDTVDQVMPGDILYLGPDTMGIHHTVLARSRITAVESRLAGELGGGPGVEVFQCHTIECTRSLTGKKTAWYAAISFFKRTGGLDGRLQLFADLAQESPDAINMFEESVPCKVLMHPFRGGRFNKHIFNEAVLWGATFADTYGRGHAVKAFMNQLRRHGHAQIIDAGDYPNTTSRCALLEKLHTTWGAPPICASLCIKVWQMYFELLAREGGQKGDAGVGEILQWMPIYCNQTTPSALLKALTARNWELRNL